MTNVEAFAQKHPTIYSWLDANWENNSFAFSLLDSLHRYGRLTDRQLAAVDKNLANAAAAAARRENAPEVVTDKLMAAFDAAKAAGLKRIKLRFEKFECSLAPETGRNAGSIYIKADGEYCGKITAGKFFATACGETLANDIAAVMLDPAAEAITYGKRTGKCCCCGRELTDPISIEAGIGPICATKFGF